MTVDSTTVFGQENSQRICVLLSSKDATTFQVAHWEELAKQFHIIVLICTIDRYSEMDKEAQSVANTLAAQGFRHGHVIAFGAAANLLLRVYLAFPKVVRSAVLVAPTLRPYPSKWQKLIQTLDGYLPLGLPFRSPLRGFDPLPFLHKVRCPMLILKKVKDLHLPSTSEGEIGIACEALARSLPIAWMQECVDGRGSEGFVEILDSFFAVPAKSPQKNLQKEQAVEFEHLLR
jgi:hypothetical protein